MKRYLEKYLFQDLQKKMVFIGGPRQVGKTTLSRQLGKNQFNSFEYFNWDVDEDRRIILDKTWRRDVSLIIFDELHKYPNWKQWIKGVYDSKSNHQNYLVTGSARLDVYKQGGDSLMGRYHYWRLHPLTLDELPQSISKEDAFQRLLTCGGFPEPFLEADEREAKRWRKERFDRIFREDIRDLENVHNIQLLYLFTDALRSRVSNLITLSNIARDLQIAPKTAKSWLQLIERMYLAFSIYPLTKNVPRSIQKPPKVYFFDNEDVTNNDGARLENLVATHLLKRIQFLEDYYGDRYTLHYLRDKDGREVDFAITKNDQLEELIEVKLTNSDLSTSLKYYTNKLNPKRATQIVGNLKRSYEKNGIRVTDPIEYFSQNIPWGK